MVYKATFQNTNTKKKHKPRPSYTWFEVWFNIVTEPTRYNFVNILRDTNASRKRGYMWMFTTFIISYIIAMTLTSMLTANTLPGAELSGGAFMIGLICASPISGIGGVLTLFFMAGYEHLFLRMTGSKGNFKMLEYSLASFLAPLLIFDNAISSVTIASPALFGVIGMILSLYIFILNVQAIRTVYRAGIFKAIMAIIVPPIVIGIALFACAMTILAGTLGPMLAEYGY